MPNYLPYDIETNSGLDSNRWNEAIEKLATLISTNSSMTREGLLKDLNETVDMYLTDIEDYLGNYEDVAPGTAPLEGQHVQTIQLAKANSKVLFNEFYRLNDVATAAFNKIVTQQKDLYSRLSRISGKARSLGLYNVDDFLGRFVGESFTSGDNLNVERSDTTLNVDFDSGVVTLPISDSKEIEIDTVRIDRSYSNGESGNAHAANVSYSYNNLASIIDNRPDTWWEYEKLQERLDIPETLSLRLVCVLKGEQIANRVILSLINLGTLSDIAVDGIEASTDGISWFDLSRDMPVADYRDEQHSDLLKITGQSSIETNSVSLYFKPTPLRYLRITLSQSEPVAVITKTGSTARRLAIGIRDITINKNTYSSSGVLESAFYDLVPPVNTTLLMAALSDLDSDLYNLDLSIGFGENERLPIQPASSSSLTTTEVLHTGNFGLEPSKINKLSFRIKFDRNDEIFSRTDPFASASDKAGQFEAFTLASRRSPITYSTGKTPLADSVILQESPIYSVGKRFSIPALTGSYLSGINSYAKLPFVTLPGNTDASWDDFSLYINGKIWNRTADIALSDIDAEEYSLVNESNFSTTRIKFGNSGGKDAHRQTTAVDATGGKALPEEALLEVFIEPERLLFLYDAGKYFARFKRTFDGNKNGLQIESQTNALSTEEKVLVPGETAYKLDPLITGAVTIKQYARNGRSYVVLATYANERTFVDGTTEVDDLGEYSIDKVNGILYSNQTCPDSRITTVSYSFYNRNTLLPSDFDIIIEDQLFVGVQIPEQNFYALTASETLADSRQDGSSFTDTPSNFEYFPLVSDIYTGGSSRIAYLSHGSIIQGTLFLEIQSSTIIPKEVPFINGVTEFGSGTEFNIEDETLYSVDYIKGLIYLAKEVPSDDHSSYTIYYQYATYRASYDVANPVTDYTVNGNILEINGDALSSESNGRFRIYYQYEPLAELGNIDLAALYTPILRDLQIRYI